ncbi:MAG: HlyD family secretion protein [Flavobacteriales bacterium]|jgi:multidrug efflux pump subunit AcrA (membrane-fusion protein)
MSIFSIGFLMFPCVIFLYGCKGEIDKKALENSQQPLTSNLIYGIGRIVPENDIIPLFAMEGGIVTKIFAQENDTVAKGDVLLEFDHQLEDERVNQVRRSLESQTAQINMDIAIVDELDAQKRNAEMELERLEKLGLISAITEQSIDDLKTKLEVLKANIKGGIARVSFSKSKKKELESELNIAQIQRKQKIITAPVSGTLLELTALLGEVISTSHSFGAIQAEGRIIVVCEVDESTAQLVRMGQKGWIRNVGTLDTLTLAQIIFTSSSLSKKSLFFDQAGEREDRRVRKVKLSLEDSNNLLLNTRVECIITIP